MAETHWDTPMPPVTQRRHESTKKGDSWGAIHRTAHMAPGRDGIKCLDMNFQLVPTRDKNGKVVGWVAMSMHWDKPGRNGYTDVATKDGGLRRMTGAERRKPARLWGYRGVKTWRRPNGERPLTYAEAVRYAAKRNVVICAELKSPAFGDRPAIAKRMVGHAKTWDHPAWFMALLSMKNASGKSETFINAGGQFALIFGRFTRQARGTNKVAGWPVKPTRVWGPASARRWLR